MKQGKVWGSTQPLIQNPLFELHRIEFKAGFKCSEHYHKHKINYFYVESGRMLVKVWQDKEQTGLVDVTQLGPGEATMVMPGLFHQFEGVEDGVAFEVYWTELNHNDIVRRTIGGSA